MAIVFNFDGKQVIEPGVYTRIVNGTTPTPAVATFGNVLLIDTGINGNGWGTGSGINGELSSGKNAIYAFDDSTSFRNVLNGGMFWDLSSYLFNPSTNGNGVNRLFYTKAATTTAAQLNFTFNGPSGAGAILVANITSGSVTSFTITNGGYGYITPPTINVATGTGQTFTASVDNNGTITSVAISGTGTGYVNTVTVVAIAGGGTLAIKTLVEGVAGNGIKYNNSQTIKGFGAKLVSGIANTRKYVMKFVTGTYHGVNNTDPDFTFADFNPATTYGLDAKVLYSGIVWRSLGSGNINHNPITTNGTNWSIFETGDDFGNVKPSQALEKVIVQSPEFFSINDLINWMKKDPIFNSYFVLSSSTVTGNGGVSAADLAANSTVQLAAGGTETYQSTDVDEVLDHISDEDFTFILCDCFGDNALSTSNMKINGYLNTIAQSDQYMVVGGGYDSGKFSQTNGSIPIAQFYNTKKVGVIHSGIIQPDGFGGLKKYSSIYHAALFLGRMAGLEPQVPVTYKDLRMTGLVHEMNKSQREKALQAGVLHTLFVSGRGWCINQAINTVQDNTSLYNGGGDSYEWSLNRIEAQLNKELKLNSKLLFVGGNLYTSSAADVKSFTNGYLQSKTVKNGQDNLIMGFKDISVVLKGDAWEVTYGYFPNSPINKIFYTSVVLDNNISL